MNAFHASAPIAHDFSSPEPLPPKRGRRSTCTPAKVTAICALIRATGISDTAAGALAGVSRAALSRGKQDEDVEVELEQARAQYLLPRLAAIADTRRKDGQLDWRAQAWLIKFAMPEVYGPPSRRRRLDKVELPPEEAEHLAAARAAETVGGRENVTFRSDMPAVPANVGAAARDLPPEVLEEPVDSALPPEERAEDLQNVTIRSENPRATGNASVKGCEERRDVSEENTTKCPETSGSAAPEGMGAMARVGRRARRAEQRRQAREAWRAARQERAA